MTRTDEHVGLMNGPSALPRKTGELVFEAPWEWRAFGHGGRAERGTSLAVGRVRARLIDEIAVADASTANTTYYERSLAALEKLQTARGVITRAELDAHAAEYRSGEGAD